MCSSRPAEPARRWRPGAWSLRTRLLATQVLLLALVCVVIGVGAELALRGHLTHQLDGQVRDVAARSALLSALPPPRPDIRHQMGQQPGPGPAFLDAPGQPIGVVAVVVGAPIPAPDAPAESPAGAPQVSAGLLTADGTRAAISDEAVDRLLEVTPGASPVTVELAGLGGYRVMAENDRFGRLTVTGLPTADLDATMLRVLWIFVVVSAVALVAASVLGALIARRAMAPLTRVAATARQVAGLPLDRGEVALPVRVADRDADPNTEVGQVGSAVNRMLEHISTALSTRQASETRVRQFVADASHELRTPLTAIRGYTELARRQRDELPEEVAHAIARVDSESERMTHLVEDLLLLARLDSGRPLERERVDLSALAVDAVSDAHIAAPDHVWNLELPEEPVLVTGDALRLHQVLANLLANAGAHTPAGATVTVSLEPGGVLSVVDDGPGIPADLQPEVFERFARGDSSRSRKDGGTGLGLAIVAAVVRAHHGTITLDSRPGRTAIIVRLPFTADA